MAPTREEWAEAYWRQGKNDWEAFTKLSAETSILNCNALHFLQMAGEKIAKAYRFRDTKADLLREDRLVEAETGEGKQAHVDAAMRSDRGAEDRGVDENADHAIDSRRVLLVRALGARAIFGHGR